MNLSNTAIVEYQQTYKRVFGKEITYGEAVEQGEKLLGLFKLVYQLQSLSHVLTPKRANI